MSDWKTPAEIKAGLLSYERDPADVAKPVQGTATRPQQGKGPNVHKHHGKCRSCNADLYWASYRGKPHPVDREPLSNGGLVLTLSSATGVLSAEPYDPTQHLRRNRYASHFSTCPHAQAHRRNPSDR